MLGFLRRLFGGGPLSGPVAAVVVDGTRLVARDAAGRVLLRVRVRGAAGTPAEGEYRIEAVLDRALRLRALFGEQGPPPVIGRAVLVVQGDAADGPTDAAVRLADADLARLLALLPGDPGQVAFRFRRAADADAAGGDDSDADDWDTSDWGSSTSDTGRRRPDTGSDAMLYAQLNDRAGTEPDPRLDTAGDQAVAAALAELGYDVRPEPGSDAAPPPAADGTADTNTDWTPAGGAYGP